MSSADVYLIDTIPFSFPLSVCLSLTYTGTPVHTCQPHNKQPQRDAWVLHPDAWCRGGINIWIGNSSLPDAVCVSPVLSGYCDYKLGSSQMAPCRMDGPFSPLFLEVQKPVGRVIWS